jgi:catalase
MVFIWDLVKSNILIKKELKIFFLKNKNNFLDFNIHIKPDYMDHVYTDLSIWDVHRTQFPFILFHDPKR